MLTPWKKSYDKSWQRIKKQRHDFADNGSYSPSYGFLGKVNIQKTKIMASSPITSWEIDGETVETVSDFILGGSKITADMKLKDAYSLEGKLSPT